MAAGGPGDHPLMDVVHWKLPVYGERVDEDLRALALLLSQRELNEWWDESVGWNCNKERAGAEVSRKLQWARQRAESSGWEPSNTP